MKRLFATVRTDFKLQFRNGFFYASAFVALVAVVVIKQFPEVDFSPWWSVIILGNLQINSFYFMSGLVLLEKGESTLEAQIVTPLRQGEYLLSKVITLGALSLVESLVIVVFVSGFRFNWFLMVAGVLLLMAIFALYGFVIVARYDSISEFLMPSALWSAFYALPPLFYFSGIWETPWMFLHPLQGPLVLVQAAFEQVPVWQIGYGFVYAALWVGLSFWLSQRAFYRFVITKAGA